MVVFDEEMRGERMFTKELIKPMSIDVSKYLGNSPLQNVEREDVATRIVVIAQWNDNNWFEFSYYDYYRRSHWHRCHQRSVSKTEERDILREFVEKGWLSFRDGRFSVNDSFIELLRQFILDLQPAAV